MIYHASIGASDPQAAAATLARLFKAKLLRLPNQFQTFSVRMKDGSMIEVWPSDKGFEADTDLHHVAIRPLPHPKSTSPFHLFVSTPNSPSDVLRIAREAGWPAYVREPQFPFSLIEVWVEKTTMLEVCPEVWLPQYLSAVKALEKAPSVDTSARTSREHA
jgi:hypothetical protein